MVNSSSSNNKATQKQFDKLWNRFITKYNSFLLSPQIEVELSFYNFSEDLIELGLLKQGSILCIIY